MYTLVKIHQTVCLRPVQLTVYNHISKKRSSLKNRQIILKYIKNCSTVVKKEIQIKTILRLPFLLSYLENFECSTIVYWQGCRKNSHVPTLLGWAMKGNMEQNYVCLPFSPAIKLLGLYPEHTPPQIQINISISHWDIIWNSKIGNTPGNVHHWRWYMQSTMNW